MTRIKIITYVTPKYEDEVKRLINSCDEYGYNLKVIRSDDRGSWEENTALKPFIVFSELSFNEPFIITDADSEVVRPIDFSIFDNCDIAVRFRKRRTCEELLSGTMFFKPTQNTYHLVSEWAYRSKKDVLTWEQIHLERCLDGVVVNKLPSEYCAIFDEVPEIENPVIKHYQASRRLRC